jgi:hypothetical protein
MPYTKDFVHIIDNLRNNKIKYVDLDELGLSEQQIQQLADALSTNTSLEILSLSINYITAESISILAQKLQTHPRLRGLNLNACFDTSKSDAKYFDALAPVFNNPNLKALSLTNNHFNPNDVNALASLIKTNNSLLWLDILYTYINEESDKILAEALKINKTLAYLRGNWGNSYGSEGLVEVYIDRNKKLKTIYDEAKYLWYWALQTQLVNQFLSRETIFNTLKVHYEMIISEDYRDRTRRKKNSDYKQLEAIEFRKGKLTDVLYTLAIKETNKAIQKGHPHAEQLLDRIQKSQQIHSEEAINLLLTELYGESPNEYAVYPKKSANDQINTIPSAHQVESQPDAIIKFFQTIKKALTFLIASIVGLFGNYPVATAENTKNRDSNGGVSKPSFSADKTSDTANLTSTHSYIPVFAKPSTNRLSEPSLESKKLKK